jgi:hypothetical protein
MKRLLTTNLHLLAFLFIFGGNGRPEDPMKHPPCCEEEIPHYTACRVTAPPSIDGRLDEPGWQSAPRSPRFRDLIHGKETIHDTRAAVLWDEEYLYVAYWIEEPDVQATLTERDSKIYMNNDVELFIAGQDTYYEFEINSFGTIYEVFFIWEKAYERGGYDKIPGLGPGLDRRAGPSMVRNVSARQG